MAASIKTKLKRIKLIILDVDGVLTDGSIIIGSDKTEYKAFNVKDGSGISLAGHVGMKFAIISGRFSEVITLRAAELKIEAVYQDIMEKLGPYEELKRDLGLKDGDICFIGDEIIDLPVFEKCGFSAAPADAVADVKKAADYACKKDGGKGCVREVSDMVLTAQGLTQKAKNRYLRHEKPGT